MRDVELYRQVLGLEAPWTVTRVDLSVTEERVDVWTGHADRVRWPCPTCGAELPVYDHAAERAWRHLDTCQFVIYVHARPPRVDWPDHGVRQVRLPWAEPHARFTLLFERLAIDVLKECDIRGATRILRISWDEAWHLLERAVARGQRAKGPRVPRRLGVDEKAVAKGHRYLTLVCDLTHATVEYIAEDRTQASLDEYFDTVPPDHVATIEAIAMDMWEPYVQSVLAHVPDGRTKIVFDKYHIMSHMGTAVDTVRKREHRVLRDEGSDVLAGSKYVWLYAGPNVPETHQSRLLGLLERPLKTARAWAIKETLRDFWQYRRVGWARLLEALVLLGDAFAARAGHQGRQDAQAASPQRPELLHASHHERRQRRAQLQDPDDQEDGLRLPQPGALQDSYLLPLRRAPALPGRPVICASYPLRSRMNLILKAQVSLPCQRYYLTTHSIGSIRVSQRYLPDAMT